MRTNLDIALATMQIDLLNEANLAEATDLAQKTAKAWPSVAPSKRPTVPTQQYTSRRARRRNRWREKNGIANS